MFGWGKRPLSTPVVDIHSHIIPAIDDGLRSIETSIDVIREFKKTGYEKIITTPHIHPNYPNTPEQILKGLNIVQEEVSKNNLDFEVEAAAEYFVDEEFMNVVKQNKPILSFGDNYVLIETSFINKPLSFESNLFELQSKGMKPILAHPERYQFLEGDSDWLYRLKEMGVLFQVTLSSFVGSYGKIPQKIAYELLKKNMIDFLGSDLHHLRQFKFLEESLQKKEIQKLCTSSKLLNNTLL